MLETVETLINWEHQWDKNSIILNFYIYYTKQTRIIIILNKMKNFERKIIDTNAE